MQPSTLLVQNYRSFPQRQQVQLRPLTLLYGNNSAGKSALVRLLPLLADSMGADDTAPLDLNSPAARRSTYADLRWKGVGEDDDSEQLLIGLEWDGAPDLTRAEFAFDMERTWNRLLIKRFEFFGPKGEVLLRGTWRFRAEEQSAPALTYALDLSGNRLEAPVQFRGLVPEVPSGAAAAPIWSLIRDRLLGLRRAVLWLSSRTLSDRILSRPLAPSWTMKSDGSDVGTVLASQPEVREEVSAWFQKHLKRTLEIRDISPTLFGMRLRHTAKPALDVDVMDSGEGVLKVIPVLTAIALSKLSSTAAPRILAIEEPESNLHPLLQQALSEYIGAMIQGRSALPSVVLETHSQHILLGVQIQVAKGLLSPEQVQVYWVYQDDDGRSVAEPVRVDEDGRLKGNWPPDVYTEVHDMSSELLRARQERRSR